MSTARRVSCLPACLAAAFLALVAVPAFATHDLIAGYEEGDRRFDEVEIGETMVVYFHQRMLGEAVVEKDYIVYQFDRNSGELLARKSHWRDDLPESLPQLRLTMDEACAMVPGQVRSARLYIISPESDVFPIEPTPENPCWAVRSVADGHLIVTVVDAVDAAIVGNGVPPPYTGFSLTGPWYFEPCSGGWTGWSGNARVWFQSMGYATEEVLWPTEEKVRSHVQSTETAMFYELAHGGSTYFASGCTGGYYGENTYSAEIGAWIANYGRMPFAFVGSCSGMCSTGNGTFAYEFRKGAPQRAVTVGYCGMGEDYCGTCWGYSIDWQNVLFQYMSLGYTVKEAFDQANAAYPACASWNCMRFEGDESFAVVPIVYREQAPWIDATAGPLGDEGYGTGVAWGDYDGDGDEDLYLADWAADNKLLRNDGGAFTDVTPAPLNDPGRGNGVAWGDYDNDGDLDLYLINEGPNKLFRNEGGGVFADVTEGPLADDANGRSVGWADYDSDGDLDLYIANNGPNRLLRNEGGPSWAFVDATVPPLDDAGYGEDVAWGHYNGDGDPDLYLTNRSGANRLFRNDGGVFFDATGGPLGDTEDSAGAAWGDYDNDGDLDLYVANMFSANRLLRNDGGLFVDVTSDLLGDEWVGTAAAWADYDNDGDLDLHLVNYFADNKLFENTGGPTWGFIDGTIAPLDNDKGGRGGAWADYDGDGDLDFYLANSNAPNRLFRNDIGTANRWLHVRLEGTASNRSAIGARVRVVADGSSQIREVFGGSNYMSQNSLTVEFGLGAGAVVETLEVRWPSGLVERAVGVPVDQVVEVVEGTWTGVEGDALSSDFALYGNFPNPFNPVTLISYELPRPCEASLRIYSASGRLVRVLMDAEARLAGGQTAPWDGRDDAGGSVASGVYFCRLEADGEALMKQMILLK